MARPRKNQPQKQNQNEHRFTDKIFEFWQQIDVAAIKADVKKMTIHRKESWMKSQIVKIAYGEDETQLEATLKLESPAKELYHLSAKKALYALVDGMQTIPELTMIMGFLLIVKSTQEAQEEKAQKGNGKQAQFKIYNLTNAQHKILINNPALLQMPFRLEVSLGLSEEQTVVFEEEQILAS